MGTVYLARDLRFTELFVAIKKFTIDSGKLSPQQLKDYEKAFEREANILARLNHESIPRVTDYFSEDENQYLVMDFVEGEDLGELIKKNKQPFSLKEVLIWSRQLLDALDYLHAQKTPIIHRDIKPLNLILTTREKVKLLDFGIAKIFEALNSETNTNKTIIGATQFYSPIEQIIRVIDQKYKDFLLEKHAQHFERINSQKSDTRADIYALGSTIYHLSTGFPPTSEENKPIDALSRALDVWAGKADQLKNPTQLNPEIPAAISDWILKAMAIEREDRFASAVEMLKALEFAITEEKKRTEDPVIPELTLSQMETIPNNLPLQPQPTRQSSIQPSPENLSNTTGADSFSSKIVKVKSQPHFDSEVQLNQFEVEKDGVLAVRDTENVDDKGTNIAASRNGKQTAKKEKKALAKPLFYIVPSVAFLFIILIGGYYYFELFSETDKTLIPFRKGDKFGFSYKSKQIAIEPKYDGAKPFSEGLAAVKLNERWGFIDTTGKEIVSPKYESVNAFSEGFAKVILFKEQKEESQTIKIGNTIIPSLSSSPVYTEECQLIDKKGNEVIPAMYDSGCELSDGMIDVSLNGKSGVIKTTGEIAIEPNYYFAGPFSDGLRRIQLNKTKKRRNLLIEEKNKYGFIDKTGKVVVNPQFDKATTFQEGVAVVGIDGKYGFIDKDGNKITDLIYDGVGEFSEGYALVKRDNKFGFINVNGIEVIEPQYEDVAPFFNGLARVKKNGKYGFIDKTGKTVIDIKYDYAGENSDSMYLRDYLGLGMRIPVKRGFFTEGLIKVRSEDKRGFIDTIGNDVINLEATQYDELQSFSDGLALIKVSNSDEWKFIDKTGNVVITKKYDYVWSFSDGLALFVFNGKHGFIDKTGRVVIEPKYDDVDRSEERKFVSRLRESPNIKFYNGLAWVWLNDKGFYIDKNGTEYYEP